MKHLIITLPKNLWWAIEHGQKLYECRKAVPKQATAGSKVYVVEEGTTHVRGYFFIDIIISTNNYYQAYQDFGKKLFIDYEWYNSYVKGCHHPIHFWKIAAVFKFEKFVDLKECFGINNNPQMYCYTNSEPSVPRSLVRILDPDKNLLVKPSQIRLGDLPNDLPF